MSNVNQRLHINPSGWMTIEFATLILVVGSKPIHLLFGFLPFGVLFVEKVLIG